MAARRDIAALVQRQGAEIARTEAAAVVDDGKLHLFDGVDAALRLVIRVVPADIGQCKDVVKLFALKRMHGRILHQKAAAVLLNQSMSAHKVLLVLL